MKKATFIRKLERHLATLEKNKMKIEMRIYNIKLAIQAFTEKK